jgi:hypothetical protein
MKFHNENYCVNISSSARVYEQTFPANPAQVAARRLLENPITISSNQELKTEIG